MTDYVRQALARTLGIKGFHIGGWKLTAVGNCMDFVEGFVSGTIEASLHVQIHREAYPQVQEVRYRDTGSIFVRNLIVEHCGHMSPQMFGADIFLARGKETQHFFKALAQQFTVRGKKSKRGSK